MDNGFFDKPTDLAPFTKAKAEDVNVRFAGVAAGFDKLPLPHLTEKGFRDPVHVGDATQRTHAPSATQIIRGTLTSVSDTGAANAYVAALPVAPSAMVAGMQVSFRAANTNTGASTLNLNGLGARAIVRQTGNALASGDIVAGQVVTVTYDGTRWVATSYLPGQAATIAAQVTTATNAATAAEQSMYVAQGHAISAGSSASHASGYADDSEGFSVSAAASAFNASQDKTAAEAARDFAVVMRNDADDFRVAAETARDDAEAAEVAAKAWADEDEDVEVEPGLYSAKHWAAKAAEVAPVMSSDVEYDIGTGGDFLTLRDAIVDLSRRRFLVRDNSGSYLVNLRILTGHIITDPITINGINLGWLTISAQSNPVRVNLPPGQILIDAHNGAVTPKINCTFDLEGYGVGTSGIGLYDGAMCVVSPNCGLINARENNFYLSRGATLVCSGLLQASGADYGVVVQGNSRAEIPSAIVTGNDMYGIDVISSFVNAASANAGTGGALRVSMGGILVAHGAVGSINQTANTLTSDGIIFQ